MIQFRLICSAFCGTLLYVVLSVCVGSEGLWAKEQLTTQQEMFYANLQHIRQLNDDLSLHLIALQVDQDMVAAYAKKLGYVSPNEYIVKVSGISQSEDFTLQVGIPYTPKPIEFIPDWICKCTGLICFFIIFYVSGLKKQRKKNTDEQITADKSSHSAVIEPLSYAQRDFSPQTAYQGEVLYENRSR